LLCGSIGLLAFITVPWLSIITVRVSKKIKETLDRYNVNVSETVRELLERYIEELELRDLARRLESLRDTMSGKIQPLTVAKLVREDREAGRVIFWTHQRFYC